MANTTLQNLESYLLSYPEADISYEKLYILDSDTLYEALTQSSSVNTELNNIRKEVDSLLSHFGIIFIGTLSGYFPYDFTDKLKNKMIRFLEIKPIREYYIFKRKYFLPEAIGAYCSAIDYGDTTRFFNDGNWDDDYFNTFLILNRIAMLDKNIQFFLDWLEQNRGEQKMDIFFEIFESKERMNDVFNIQEDIETGRYTGHLAVGAVHYSNFIIELKELLESMNSNFELGNTVLQSAIWHFYGIYFENLSKSFIKIYTGILPKLLKALESELAKPEFQNDSESVRETLILSKKMKDIIISTMKTVQSFFSEGGALYAAPLRVAARYQTSNVVGITFVPEPA